MDLSVNKSIHTRTLLSTDSITNKKGDNTITIDSSINILNNNNSNPVNLNISTINGDDQVYNKK